jgi:hypothetical protein
MMAGKRKAHCADALRAIHKNRGIRKLFIDRLSPPKSPQRVDFEIRTVFSFALVIA